MEYKYDKHPLIDCRKYGSVISDSREIISELEKKDKLIVELYPGVDKKKILPLFSSLQYDTVIDTEALKKENSLLVKEFEEYITDDRVFGYMCPRDMNYVFDKEKLNKAKEAASKARRLLVIGTGASLVTTDGTIIYCDISRWEIELSYRKGLSNWLISNSSSPSLQKFKIGYFVEWRMADKLKMSVFENIAYFLDTHSGMPLMIQGEYVRNALNSIPSSPFRLEPYFDPGVWGGQWMKKKFNLPEDEKNYAWSFDGVPEENAINLLFEGGEIKLPAIDAVLYTPERLLGSRVYGRYGAEFPIRFDFLDTIGGGNLSLQVHPMTSYIQKKFGMHYTQDESYYILDADENASVYLGVKTGTDKDEMIKELEEAEKGNKPFKAEKFVNRIEAKKHDHFLIPAGTVHCSGKGSMVLEISSTPYIFTFKLWDWGRVGLDGIPRPVHINHGKENIQFSRDTEFVKKNLVNHFSILEETENVKVELTGLDEREPVETRRYTIKNTYTIHMEGSVEMLNLVDGKACTVESTNNSFAPFTVHYAETFIIPAEVGEYTVRAIEGPVMLIQARIR